MVMRSFSIELQSPYLLKEGSLTVSVPCVSAEEAPVAFEMSFINSDNPCNKVNYRYYQGKFWKNFHTPEIVDDAEDKALFTAYTRRIEIQKQITLRFADILNEKDGVKQMSILLEVLMVLPEFDTKSLFKALRNHHYIWGNAIKRAFEQLIDVNGDLYRATHEPHIKIKKFYHDPSSLMVEVTDTPMSGSKDKQGLPRNAYSIAEKEAAFDYAHEDFWKYNKIPNGFGESFSFEVFCREDYQVPLVNIARPEFISITRDAQALESYLQDQKIRLAPKDPIVTPKSSTNSWAW